LNTMTDLPVSRPRTDPPSPPADLASFWTTRLRRATAVEVGPRILADEIVAPDVRRLRLEYTSTDDVTIGAWITLPADGVVDRGIVRVHGYGGTAEADVIHPDLPRTAVIWPCARGLGELSLSPALPAAAPEHVLHGIESTATYIHGGCVEDVWCAIDALEELVPGVAGRIDLIGGSFGGGIGIMATAWDPRIRSAVVDVPSFGDHPVRVTIPCEGSGEAVRLRWLDDPAVLDVLAYFDAASCARFIDVPVLIAPALSDPFVPPAGQWSIADALPDSKQVFPLTAGHVAYPEEARERAAFEQATIAFLSDGEPVAASMPGNTAAK
jgi:cephalosporin-C deacetylase